MIIVILKVYSIVLLILKLSYINIIKSRDFKYVGCNVGLAQNIGEV